MLQVSPETLPRYKLPKASAIRHFPRGCGPNEVKSYPKPAVETSSPVGLENSRIADSDNVLGGSIVWEETVAPSLVQKNEELNVLVSVGVLHHVIAELTGSMTCVTSENNLTTNPEYGKLEVQELVRESSESPKLQNGHCYSKIYGPPKKRKVLSIRKFPPRCGPSSDSISRDGLQPVCAPPSLLKAKNLVGKKLDVVSKHLVGDNTPSVAAAENVEGQMRKNDGIEVILETCQGTRCEPGIRPQIASPKYKILQWEKKNPDLKQQEMAGCSTLIPYTKNDLHPMENMPLVKQPLVIDKSAQVAGAEHHLNHEKSMAKQATAADKSVEVAFSEKARVENGNDSKVVKGKEENIGKSILVRSNTNKNSHGSETQGAIGHVQIKFSLKSGSNTIFVQSISDKLLEGCKGDQTDKNLQIKENAGSPSHVVLKSKFGSKLLDKDGKPLVGKHSVKESEITQKGSDSLKRKLSAEILYKDHVLDEGEDSLEAYGERMIIQSLLAAENCPWMNSKRHAIGSGSVFLKCKIKKKGLVERNSASKVLSSSQQKNKGLIEDIDHMLGEDISWKELATFQKPNELSVTMTPFVPSELSQKGGYNEEVLARHRVKRVLRIFQLICRKLLQGEESSLKRLGKVNRIDLQASKVLKDNGEWVSNGEPLMGHVPGVEIGDEFHYRVELSIIGLHRLFQGGIDSMKQNGMLLAVSIVASGGYEDDVDGSDVLIYSGSGGITAGDKQPGDQKLERGNLALKNSIDAQTPVRVIHGFKEKVDPRDAKGKLVSTFTYAGLYYVESYWQERGPHGFNVFKFLLKRKTGQPDLAFKELKRSAILKIREGLCVNDISVGKEKIPISVVNTIDTDHPMPFKYITKSIYPSCYVKTPPRGCDCIDGCSDSEKCACAVKNGGEIPYNFSGAIVQAKPLIYECGPSCKCLPLCHNRVGQHGIRMQLEVFKTRGRGWGVRSLRSISSGSFICGYIGELLQDGEAEQRTNDEYLFDIGHNYDDRSLWEDLPNFIPELQSSSAFYTVENVGFTIDAAEYGNIGRFINHSCSPNLYAQNVLYDHDDKRIPHIMFFAVDNIPPLQELTYHYNYKIDQVRDSEGNIMQKACHCGSPECCGRLY